MFCRIVFLFKCLSLGRGVIARTRCRHDELLVYKVILLIHGVLEKGISMDSTFSYRDPSQVPLVE